jgi:MFS transporter, ACS family, glucarate transporter
VVQYSGSVDQSKNSRVRWLLIFWMFVVSAVAYIDRVNISIAGPEIANEFHLDDPHLGLVFSAFVLGYALFQTPGGALADRLGPRKVLGLGVVWWAVFTVMITVISPTLGYSLLLLIAIRFALGMGEAVVYPASNCIVASWIPGRERGIANGIIFAGVGFGSGMTPPLIAFLKVHYGWRSCFWASAILGLIAGAVWYFIARNKPSQHPWVSPGELALIEDGLPPAVAKGKISRLSWGVILSDKNVWAVTFSYFTYGYIAWIFFTWFFKYLGTVRKLDLSHSTVYTMIPLLAMGIASPLGGWISDRLTKQHGKRVGRCYLAAVAIGLCAVLIAIGTLVASAQAASIVLAAGAGALYISQSSFWSISADIGKSSAGSVSGFMNMGGQFGGALTASLTPWIAKNYGWTASFLVAACLCAAGAVAWLLVKPEPEAEIGTA